VFSYHLDDTIHVDGRLCARRHCRCWRIIQPLVDLIVEDQGQAGKTQHQQEQGADEAGPPVYEYPSGRRAQHISGRRYQ
jgi:hypothetical protein